ncbi:MAG: mannitol dehydrogenase family protein, partial [Lachnospiraceae bacterium]|nr:mannitol dehydrogenase family protein [Lachnospiraceae bacterium]
PSGAMGVVASMLYERFLAGAKPLALVSMDNVSQNGRKLRESVIKMAEEWNSRGYVPAEFLDWLKDEKSVSFPWSMIDKITPRPGDEACRILGECGIEDMEPVVTSKHTYIAPFANAEEPQYLVIEDSFPNGRPPLEEAGVFMTDRETVNKAERMKVTACLNPIHTALCVYDVMFGHTMFADGMEDPDIRALAECVGYREGLPVVEDPGILSPKEFIDEVIGVRFPNVYLGDTSARIAVDISQMTAIRFGETIKSYVARYGDARKLVGIPLAIAGWLRYILAVDDNGDAMELSPDPMIPYMKEQLQGIEFGKPDSLKEQLKNVLSNETLFGTDLYQAGIGELIEEMVRSEIAGKGAARETLRKYLGN